MLLQSLLFKLRSTPTTPQVSEIATVEEFIQYTAPRKISGAARVAS